MNIIQRIEVVDSDVYVKFSDLKYDKAPIIFSANIASASIYYYEEIAMNQPNYLSCAKLRDQLFEMMKMVKFNEDAIFTDTNLYHVTGDKKFDK